MNTDKITKLLQTYLRYAETKRDNQPLGSMDYAYYDGFSAGVAQLLNEIEDKDDQPFNAIPNPLENDYQWP